MERRGWGRGDKDGREREREKGGAELGEVGFQVSPGGLIAGAMQ